MRFMRMLSVGYLLEDRFSLMLMVHPTGFEPVTSAFGGQKSCTFRDIEGQITHKNKYSIVLYRSRMYSVKITYFFTG